MYILDKSSTIGLHNNNSSSSNNTNNNVTFLTIQGR